MMMTSITFEKTLIEQPNGLWGFRMIGRIIGSGPPVPPVIMQREDLSSQDEAMKVMESIIKAMEKKGWGNIEDLPEGPKKLTEQDQQRMKKAEEKRRRRTEF